MTDGRRGRSAEDAATQEGSRVYLNRRLRGRRGSPDAWAVAGGSGAAPRSFLSDMHSRSGRHGGSRGVGTQRWPPRPDEPPRDSAAPSGASAVPSGPGQGRDPGLSTRAPRPRALGYSLRQLTKNTSDFCPCKFSLNWQGLHFRA